MTTHESTDNQGGSSTEASAEPKESDNSAESTPSAAASGIRSKLSEAQQAMLASKSRGGGGQGQSVGKSHQPTQASGKKGPVEKKTRW